MTNDPMDGAPAIELVRRGDLILFTRDNDADRTVRLSIAPDYDVTTVDRVTAATERFARLSDAELLIDLRADGASILAHHAVQGGARVACFGVPLLPETLQGRAHLLACPLDVAEARAYLLARDNSRSRG